MSSDQPQNPYFPRAQTSPQQTNTPTQQKPLTPLQNYANIINYNSTKPNNNTEQDYAFQSFNNNSNNNVIDPNSTTMLSRAEPSPHFTSKRIQWRKKLVLCLVGLPARGKSWLAYKLVGYLRWRGLQAQLFNVGKHRRNVVITPQDAKFFDANNKEAQTQRDQLAFQVLDEMLDWLEFSGGDIAVFDATNTTNKRRWEVVRCVTKRSPQLRVIFVESMCDDKYVLEKNYLVKAQNSPDYKNLPLEEALNDLKLRVANYEKVYEPIRDDYLSYLKLINLNSKVICNRIFGQLGQIIASFLMSIHIQPRPIFLTRAGSCDGLHYYTICIVCRCLYCNNSILRFSC